MAGGHAVLAVGVVDEDNKDCLIFKNSSGYMVGSGRVWIHDANMSDNFGVVAHVVGVSSA